MISDEEWLNAGAALIAHKVPDARPLAELLRNRKEIPEATIHLLADLLDPPPGAPLGVQFKIADTHGPASNSNNVPANASAHGRSVANAYRGGLKEPPQAAITDSAKLFYETSIQLAKRYAKLFMKWINHDI